MKRLLLTMAVAVGLVAASAGQAQAALITASGQTFSFDFSGTVVCPGENCDAGVSGTFVLEATADFSVTSFSAGQLVLEITLRHTTELVQSGLTLSGLRLTALGWDQSPVPTSTATISGGTVFDGVRLNQTFPGFQRVDVCAFAGENCSAANDGLLVGAQDIFTVTLNGDFGSSVLLEPAYVRFANQIGSFTFESTSVPEPTTLALLGMAFMLTGASLRRRT